MFIGKAPLRISFAGGGTDLEEYHEKFIGHTISFTINRFSWVIAKLRRDQLVQGFSPDFAGHLPPTKISQLSNVQGHEIVIAGLKEMKFKGGVDMYLCSDVEPNSGLGASSSLTSNLVNVILKLQGQKWDKNRIAIKAYHIGHDILKWGIGKQDEFAAIYGGLNLFTYSKEKVSVKSVKLKRSTINELQNNSLLFKIGKRKHSVNILQKQIKNINQSKAGTLESLHRAKELAIEMYDALREDDLEEFSDLLNKGWEVKKQYASGISNSRIEKISKLVFKQGVKALKITGAGGGGHMFLYAENKFHSSIEDVMKKVGAYRVPFEYLETGAKVLDINNL